VAFRNPPPDHDPFPADPRRRIEPDPPTPPLRRVPEPVRRPRPRYGRKAWLTTALVLTILLCARLELRDAAERNRRERELQRAAAAWGVGIVRLTPGRTPEGRDGIRLRVGDLDRVVPFAPAGSSARLDVAWDALLADVEKRLPRDLTRSRFRIDVAKALRSDDHVVATELLVTRIHALADPDPWESRRR
jgi:hypothetical protein